MKKILLIALVVMLACSSEPFGALPVQSETQVKPLSTLPQPDIDVGELIAVTVLASTLYVRDVITGDVVDHIDGGEEITCRLTDSGWCLLENGTKVWAGCLDIKSQYGCGKK